MIKPGEELIEWYSFKACSDQKKVIWIENGKINIIGSTTEEVSIDEEKDLLHRKQELVFLDPNKETRTIQLSIKSSTFEPIKCIDKGNIVVEMQYHSNEVVVEIDEKGNKTSMKYAIENGVFDLFSLELLLRLLPLDLGFKTELQAFNHMVKDTVHVRIEVVKLEKISDGYQEVDAWVVHLFFGENLQTYWISCETKELLKQSIKVSDGVFFDFVR